MKQSILISIVVILALLVGVAIGVAYSLSDAKIGRYQMAFDNRLIFILDSKSGKVFATILDDDAIYRMDQHSDIFSLYDFNEKEWFLYSLK